MADDLGMDMSNTTLWCIGLLIQVEQSPVR